MFGRKKTLGMKAKTRTLAEVNQDYNDNAVNLGHKTRVIREIQSEIDQHTLRLIQISEEAKNLPPERPTPPTPPAVA